MNILERLIFASLNTYDDNIAEVKLINEPYGHSPRINITIRLANGVEFTTHVTLERALEFLERDTHVQEFVDSLYATCLAKTHGYEIEACSAETMSRMIEEILGGAFR